MNNIFYLLNPDKSVRSVSTKEYLDSDEEFKKTKVIQQDFIGDYFISTVFLGVSFDARLFETMIFKKNHDIKDFIDVYCERYYTYDEALENHLKLLKEYRNEKV